MALKIVLKANEKIVVNGAVISAGDHNVALYFLNNARILREKDIVTEGDVVGPESRLYFILQLMYIDPLEAPRYGGYLTPVIEELLGLYPEKAEVLERILALAAEGQLFKAMRSVKKEFGLSADA